MWPLMLAGAGLGLVKTMEDKKQADKDRRAQAIIAQYSPWTGMQARNVQDPSLMGNVMQGGMTGASFGQAMSQAEAQDAMNKRQAQLIDAQTGYYQGMTPR